MKKALVFGANSQAGSYLCELLLEKGYKVYGTVRTSSYNLCGIEPRLELFWHVDLMRADRAGSIIRQVRPDEVYNFAARMHAEQSWTSPDHVLQINGRVVLEMLEALYQEVHQARFFQAGSADCFGPVVGRTNADTPMRPDTPYGLAKVVARESARIYRERKGLFACTGIFYNMESSRRSGAFFAQKVIQDVIEGKLPLQYSGLDSVRDWGYAPEYVEAAWRMLQANQPKDYIIATGEEHTCREFVEEALNQFGYGETEDTTLASLYTETGPKVASAMRVDPSKIEHELGWKATTRFKQVIQKLLEAKKVPVHG